MLTPRQKLRKNNLIRFLASIKITVTGLVLLFILTFWGTVAQVQSGLYITQERYFHSFFFLILGFVPFPGAQLVMWVLFINLLTVAIVRLNYKWRNLGIIIIHFGLLIFFVAGFFTLHRVEESSLALREGEGANVSTSYDRWEIAVWQNPSPGTPAESGRVVSAVDALPLKSGRPVDFGPHGFQIAADEYYRNCDAFLGKQAGPDFINASGIARLQPADLNRDPEKNIPGGIFRIVTADAKKYKILLYGGEETPASFESNGYQYLIELRRKKFPLPFILRLDDFMMENHPGTETARSYKSKVEVQTGEQWREKLISMNNPLRYQAYTFYQSSYSVDKEGRESSIFAVVKNSGRLLPYIATFVTFAGLAIHFIVMGFNVKKKPEPLYAHD